MSLTVICFLKTSFEIFFSISIKISSFQFCLNNSYRALVEGLLCIETHLLVVERSTISRDLIEFNIAIEIVNVNSERNSSL